MESLIGNARAAAIIGFGQVSINTAIGMLMALYILPSATFEDPAANTTAAVAVASTADPTVARDGLEVVVDGSGRGRFLGGGGGPGLDDDPNAPTFYTGFPPILYFGLCVTFSSTILVLGFLKNSKQMDSMHGQMSLALLVLQDITAVLALAVLAALTSGGDLTMAFVSLIIKLFAFAAARYSCFENHTSASVSLHFIWDARPPPFHTISDGLVPTSSTKSQGDRDRHVVHNRRPPPASRPSLCSRSCPSRAPSARATASRGRC